MTNLKDEFQLSEHYSLKEYDDYMEYKPLEQKIIVDEMLCSKCGECAKICISQCIKLNPFPIVNMKKCVVCVRCISLCPNNALNTKRSKGKKRYKGLGTLNIQPIKSNY